MDNGGELFFDHEPEPESETIVTLDIVSQRDDQPELETTNGLVLEGKITLNPERSLVYFLPSTASTPKQLMLTLDRAKWDLYLIIIPFTLHEAYSDKYYQKITFFVDLANPDATAFDLFPKSILSQEEVTQTYALSSQFKIKGVDANLEYIGQVLRFGALRPIIQAAGEGENKFYWTYRGISEHDGVIPEIKYALIVLQVPHGTLDVNGTIHYEVVLVKKWFGLWEQQDSRTDTHPIHWKLGGALPLFQVEVREPLDVKKLEAMPTTSTTKDFFISYASADQEWAEWIAWQLEQAGYSTILQSWDFQPGSNVVVEVNNATQNSHRTLIVLSPDYLNATSTQPEWATAFMRDPTGQQRTMLPVRVRLCNAQGLLGSLVYIDLTDQPDKDAAREILLRGLKPSRPIHPPAFPTNADTTHDPPEGEIPVDIDDNLC